MSLFRFKQFTVKQEAAAMKVGTDATILGAWADITDAKKILDIGSGTGVLALMAAQRNAQAEITAIELDEAAFSESKFNFENCPWHARLKVFHSPVQGFESDCRFDGIISNPPYFDHKKHLKATEEQRRLARSTDSLTYQELCASVERLMNDNGSFHLILPVGAENDFVKIAAEHKLLLYRKTAVKPSEEKASNRVLMSFSKIKKPYLSSQLIIRNSDSLAHDYSPEFTALLKDFLIIF